MLGNQRLMVEAAYHAWSAEDLDFLSGCMHSAATTYIRLPPGTWPMSGILRGRPAILNSLGQIARSFRVLEYRPTKMTGADGVWTCRGRVQYGHRASGLVYEATMRNVWVVRGDKIVSYEVIHDADRLRAYFQLVSQANAESR